MYIISKHKDYYDYVVGLFGVDKTQIFERHVHSVVNKESYIKNNDRLYGKNDPRNNLHIIGFCGKTYILYKKESSNGVVECIYDLELIKEELGYNKHTIYSSRIYDNIIDKYHNKESDLFLKYKTPYFTCMLYYYNKNIEITPLLEDIQFYKKMDAYEAFQEISMYLGVLNNSESESESESIENGSGIISDKIKINSHGYDKWSFRNPDPPKRKNKN